jgi:hypothetical protein
VHNSQRWKLEPAVEVPEKGGVRGEWGESCSNSPIPYVIENKPLGGSGGSGGCFLYPTHARAHAHDKGNTGKHPQLPPLPQSPINSDTSEWGSAKPTPPDSPQLPHWLEGVP